MEISDKMTQSEGDAFKDWRAYSDPAGRFVVRYPPEWTISGEQPDTVRIQEPGRLAEFSIKYSEIDCITAQSNLRARRLNYYLVREFIRQVARHPANALEFRDTISNRRDFRA